MFPLGTVLLPFAPLALHVFEPRYRALARDCLAGSQEFGVVLIERGSEVGGGDVRFSVGTVARITQAAVLPDGRYLLDTVGTRRVRVNAWLGDEPYPIAEVSTFDEEAPGSEAQARRSQVERLLHRALALQAELGETVPSATTSLDSDPLRASYEAAMFAPVGSLDLQHLLEEPGPDRRLRALADLLEDSLADLGRRLAGG